MYQTESIVYRAKSNPTGSFLAHTHTHALPQARARPSSLYTIFNINLAYKQGLTTEGDSSARGENIAGLLFWEKKCFEVGSKTI